MKREILRISDFSYEYSPMRKLKDISLYLMEGESVGFLGLSQSGKDFLVRILSGQTAENLQNIYIDGRCIVSGPELGDYVYRIVASNYQIEDWNIAEYIGLVTREPLKGFLSGRSIVTAVQEFLDSLDFPLDASKRLGELSELEKRITDLAKACYMQVKVLIVEDQFEGMTPEEIREFGAVMRRLLKGRMAAVISSHSDMVSEILSDKYVIFNRGRIVKKCRKEYIKGSAHLEKFLLGDDITSRKQHLDSCNIEQNIHNETVYKVENIPLLSGNTMDLSVGRGEVVTLLELDRQERENLFMLLSGRNSQPGMTRFLKGHRISFDDYTEFVRSKIVSIVHMGGMDELLPSMTVGENLLVPSLTKISSLDYMYSSGKMTKMLKKAMQEILVEPDAEIGQMEVNDLIGILLERWYIYHPRVLVMIEPFIQCDVYGVSLVKSYIRKFKAMGTAVIIIKSRDEYIEDISDRILRIG